MAQTVNLTPKGLYSEPNALTAPPGAMSQADDITISRDNLVEPRRGAASVAAQNFERTFPFKWQPTTGAAFAQQLIGWRPNGAGGGLYYDSASGGSSWTSLGASVLAAGTFLRAVESAGRLFFAASDRVYALRSAVYALDGVSQAPLLPAGAPPALDISCASSGAGTAIPTGQSVAYRVVFGIVTGSGIAWGAPSGRSLFTNAAGYTVNVTVTVTVPASLSGRGDWLCQLYRSPCIASGTTPSDDLQLVSQAGPGLVVFGGFTDSLPDALLGAALYTNATQQSAAGAYYPPPQAADVAAYRGCLFYAQTKQPASGLLHLMSVGSPGLQVGDTITVTASGSVTLTAAAAENIAAKQFLCSTGGTLQQNIQATADSIVRVLNRATWTGTQGAGAQYASAATDPAGILSLAAFTPGVDVTFNCSRAVAFWETGAGAVTFSASDRAFVQPNALYWSEPQIPDSVPLVNYAAIGSGNDPILRIVPTRDSLFIFKSDGLWRLTGDAAPWTITPFDPTCLLRAPDTAVMLDNAIFAMTNQGVVRITDTGVSVVSRPVEPSLLPLLSPPLLATTQSLAFGVAYESNRKYHLWVPTLATDTQATQGYVFDLFTKTWTRDTRAANHAVVSPADDRLYIVDGTSVWQERKTFTAADYADGTNPIACAWTFAPHFGTSPGKKHHFTIVALLFRIMGAASAALNFWTDIMATPQADALDFTVYGSLPLGVTSVRTWTPLEASRGSQLFVQVQVSVNGQAFQFQGLAISARETSEEAGN